jgi:hypothetical protein
MSIDSTAVATTGQDMSFTSELAELQAREARIADHFESIAISAQPGPDQK